ncbi:hypothetical protein [Ruminococcus difficilis]|nr:hypothetical protein [Ruminococcus difficilis]
MNSGFHFYAAWNSVEYDEDRLRGINDFCTLIKQHRGGNET